MRKRILSFIAAVILCFVLGGIITGALSLVISRGVDFSLDEQLFSNAKGEGSTSYYALSDNGEEVLLWQDSKYGIKDWYSIDQMGSALELAFLSSEDREFYEHSGVNVKRTFMAFINHLFHFRDRFGASTITQQVVKNISGDSSPTVKRKFFEIVRALRMEREHTKSEILELYLNIIPMANNIFGVGTAARLYFNKMPSELSYAEAATLAGITNSPSRYNPLTHSEELLEKRNRVLYAMLDNGKISKDEYDSAISEELSVNTEWDTVGISSWFVECASFDVLNDLMKSYSVNEGTARLMLRGAKIILTVNEEIQEELESYFSDLSNLPQEHSDGLDLSFVVYDNYSGDVIGLIGRSGEKSGNKLLNLATAPVIPGSTLKPLALYAPLIDLGLANAASLFDDVPIYYNNTDGGIVGYPKNSPDKYSGAITLADAVAYSKNTVAMEILEQLGNDKVYSILRDKYCFALSENDKYPAPLALGQLTNGISLRELSRGYAAFPREGVLPKGRTYYSVYSKDNTPLLENMAEEHRVMEYDTAGIMTSLLQGVVDYGTARGIRLKGIVDTAGKTGTSGKSRDKLFVGFTPYVTAGIWCGYPDKSEEIGSLSPSHIEIWDDIMLLIHEKYLLGDKEKPSEFSYRGLTPFYISSADGRVLCDACDDHDGIYRIAYFSQRSMPAIWCDIHSEERKYLPA